MDGDEQVLGVGTSPTRAELARAYRRRAYETHPDRGGSLREFLRVKEAYLALGGGLPGRRAPVAVLRLEPDMVDFGTVATASTARRAVLVSCEGGAGGDLFVEPLRGAWFAVVGALAAGQAGDLAVVVLAARAAPTPGFHEGALVLRVGAASAVLPIVARARPGA